MDLPRDGRDSFVVINALRRLVRELRESARLAQGRAQITGAQLFVLRALVAEPGLSINELAERTMTHQSTVSVVVSRLVARALVTRVHSADDRRRMVVTPTARGRALHLRAPVVAQEKLVAAVRDMMPARRRALAAELTELANALGAPRDKPSMFFEEDDHEDKDHEDKDGANAPATRPRKKTAQLHD